MTAEGSASEQALRTAILWMLVLTVVFMIYASLYPFEFDVSRFATLDAEGLDAKPVVAPPGRAPISSPTCSSTCRSARS